MANALCGGKTLSMASIWEISHEGVGDNEVAARVMRAMHRQRYATHYVDHPQWPEQVGSILDELLGRRVNLLAIQVVRNSKANEIGLGGLIRPSFVFSGPRLERKSPRPLELRRVLPGGELE